MHTHTHTLFNGHFPGKPGLAGSHLILIQGVLKQQVLQAKYPSCHPTNSVKALKDEVCYIAFHHTCCSMLHSMSDKMLKANQMQQINNKRKVQNYKLATLERKVDTALTEISLGVVVPR